MKFLELESGLVINASCICKIDANTETNEYTLYLLGDPSGEGIEITPVDFEILRYKTNRDKSEL